MSDDVIRVTCSHCRQRLRIKRKMAGSRVPCANPKCKKPIDVPNPSSNEQRAQPENPVPAPANPHPSNPFDFDELVSDQSSAGSRYRGRLHFRRARLGGLYLLLAGLLELLGCGGFIQYASPKIDRSPAGHIRSMEYRLDRPWNLAEVERIESVCRWMFIIRMGMGGCFLILGVWAYYQPWIPVLAGSILFVLAAVVLGYFDLTLLVGSRSFLPYLAGLVIKLALALLLGYSVYHAMEHRKAVSD